MNTKISDWLAICVWRALLGEIYPSIRAIAIAILQNRKLTIRYYLDHQPSEFDFESIDVVATNISASIGRDLIEEIAVDCRYSTEPIGTLDCLDGLVYCRREYEIP